MPLDFGVVAQIQKNVRYQLRRWSGAKSAWIPISDHGNTLYDEAEARQLLAEFRSEGDTYITLSPDHPDTMGAVD